MPRLFGGPRASAQRCHKNIAVHRLQQVSAHGFENRCFSCSERWRNAFGHLLFEDFAAHANTTAGAEDLTQYESTKAGTKPDWIPEDVLVETSTQVCVERSVLVLTAAELRREMEKPLPGSRWPELPTMMLPSEQNDDVAERTEVRRV